ncbi:MAG: 4Fe-4S binding protein [Paludibacteraceae bacterium]|nr:4Fe-4S binding protein [Paludibacteraceae bacterium]MCR5298395.1 4Fe-4S binding protein [Paludibacteraceae bacterium]
MKSFYLYIKELFEGICNLILGLKISMMNFLRPKVTEQYPENRKTAQHFDRFRARLVMPHNEKNEHKCIACGICEMNCPNGTIQVLSSMVEDPETGRKKKVLDKYIYDLGTCTFCNMCVTSCPHKAIAWSQDFEQAVFDRDRLYCQLNAEGSHVESKTNPTPKTEGKQNTSTVNGQES